MFDIWFLLLHAEVADGARARATQNRAESLLLSSFSSYYGLV
jgi:hypothetical protein